MASAEEKIRDSVNQVLIPLIERKFEVLLPLMNEDYQFVSKSHFCRRERDNETIRLAIRISLNKRLKFVVDGKEVDLYSLCDTYPELRDELLEVLKSHFKTEVIKLIEVVKALEMMLILQDPDFDLLQTSLHLVSEVLVTSAQQN